MEVNETNALRALRPEWERSTASTAQRAGFYRMVRAAARPLRDDGWSISTATATLRGPDGEWGHIRFAAQKGEDPLPVDIWAGSASRYLIEVLHRQPPGRPLPSHFVAVHTRVLWQHPIAYDPLATGAVAPLSLPPAYPRDASWRATVLGPSTAPGWLAGAFDLLAPVVRALTNDLAIRDRLVEAEWFDAAALLTRHLGRHSEVPELLERAEAAHARRAVQRRARGFEVVYHDRSPNYFAGWSFDRFRRFFESCPY